MKLLALDPGDVWVGSALSDPLGIVARPYKTVARNDLYHFLEHCLKKEAITAVIVGYPVTMNGKESKQTKKTSALKKKLEKKFPYVTWILWDERLSSQRAKALLPRGRPTQKEKIQSHSRAAAFILQSYLDYHASLPKTP